MATTIGTPSNFTLQVDLSKRSTASAPGAAPASTPTDSFSPQEKDAIDKLPSRAQFLAQFQKNPQSIATTENGYGLQKKTSFENLEKAFLKSHSAADEAKMFSAVEAEQKKAGGFDPSKATLAMSRLMAQSLNTQDAFKMEAQVAAAIEGGNRAGGAKYDLTHPARPRPPASPAKLS